MSVSKEAAARIFSRFSPFIRDYIYADGWTQLREVQLEAARILFDTDDDLLITSATASGKTEAALFPVLSMMHEAGAENFTVLYIAPLKSLINDQFLRMETLLEQSGIPVFHWHGDVGVSHKQRFLKHPAGLLQITPESLESMLLNRSNDIPRLFSNLRFILLDEIHTLPGRDRGEQTRCLVERIASLVGHVPRRIGLSATVGDTDAYARWLGSGGGRKCSVVAIPQTEVRWRLSLEHFFSDDGPENDDGDGETDGSRVAADAALDYVYAAVRKKKSIVFSNSREETEHVTASLRQLAKRRGEPDVFYIHHGNLSAAIREETEQVLKEEKQAVACATVTLELGIDIGRLERTVNVESPSSVTGFLQRIGRSGRRGAPCEMLMVFREEPAVSGAPLFEWIPWQLLQGIAIVQLYLEERWVEPPCLKQMPMSLLFHRVLATVGAGGSMSVNRLAGKVLRHRCFAHITPQTFSTLLSHMVKSQMLCLDEKRELMVGIKGEQLLSNYKFYAVFSDREEFMVREGSQEIGTVTTVPPVGERFALAGRVWEVLEQDVAKRLVYVKGVEGSMEVAWPGDSGEIHTRILQRMKQVLQEDTVYPYLGKNAVQRLEQARRLAVHTGMLEQPVVHLGGNRFVLFPWLGTRGVRTLKRFIQRRCAHALGISAVENGHCYYITFQMAHPDGSSLISFMKEILKREGEIHSWDLVSQTEHPLEEKYDRNVPQKLLLEAFCKDRLDVDEAAKWILEQREESFNGKRI